MSAVETLREAARAERDEWGSELSRRVYPKSSAIHLAVAAMLDEAAATVEGAFDPETYAENSTPVRLALVTARAILGNAS